MVQFKKMEIDKDVKTPDVSLLVPIFWTIVFHADCNLDILSTYYDTEITYRENHEYHIVKDMLSMISETRDTVILKDPDSLIDNGYIRIAYRYASIVYHQNSNYYDNNIPELGRDALMLLNDISNIIDNKTDDENSMVSIMLYDIKAKLLLILSQISHELLTDVVETNLQPQLEHVIEGYLQWTCCQSFLMSSIVLVNGLSEGQFKENLPNNLSYSKLLKDSHYRLRQSITSIGTLAGTVFCPSGNFIIAASLYVQGLYVARHVLTSNLWKDDETLKYHTMDYTRNIESRIPLLMYALVSIY